MREREGEKIRLGVSACLLGARVRHDGGHKKDPFLTDTLGPFVEWIPVCPEVEVGLGIPRDTLRLVGDGAAPRLVVERTGEDLTERMRRYARAKARDLEPLGLDGYVLKRASPSCGLLRVRVHRERGPALRRGRGLYADALVRRLPTLPVEEEGRLADAAIREHFVERVFAAARWRAFLETDPTPRDLAAFHAAQKLTILAHSPAHWAKLGRLVAALAPGRAGSRRARGSRYRDYGALFLDALAIRATRARHAAVLRRLARALARDLDGPSRAELADVVHAYRRGLVPLVVPLTLVNHHVRRLGVTSLADQAYLDPHPAELMLRNRV